MAKRILTVGVDLAGEATESADFSAKTSLLDWDLIIFRPDIEAYISRREIYKGRPSLSDGESFEIKEACEHWRREIKQAIDAGKTVFVFLSALQEIYIDTGNRQYSGTGRNRATTRLVAPYDNYECLPLPLRPTNAEGSGVKLVPKGAEILAPYWAEFGPVSKYKVILEASPAQPCLLTKDGDKPVGIVARSTGSAGSLVCLPDMNFYREGFLGDDDDEEGVLWTKEAEQFAHRLLASLVSLDSALRGSSELTPEPEWALSEEFVLAEEVNLRTNLLEAEQSLEDAQRRKEEVLENLRAAGQLRGLLYEKGKPLEFAILKALRILGFDASAYADGNSEFDAVFECAEGRLIGEAEGKDSKAVNVDKLRQLTMNIHEDLERDEVQAPAKGALFGNGYRLAPPGTRQVAFTEKCILAAKSNGTALITTSELFVVAKHILDNQDQTFSAKCRQAILNTVGIVTFPEVPKTEPLAPPSLKD